MERDKHTDRCVSRRFALTQKAHFSWYINIKHTYIIYVSPWSLWSPPWPSSAGHPSYHPASRYLCTLQHRSLETVHSLGCCSPWLLWPSFFSSGCRLVVILPRYFLLFIMMMMMVFMFTNQYSCLELAIFVVEASSTPQAPLNLPHPQRNQKNWKIFFVNFGCNLQYQRMNKFQLMSC